MFKGVKRLDVYSYLLTFILLAVSGNPLFISNQVYIVLTIFLGILTVAKNRYFSVESFVLYLIPFLLIFSLQVFKFSNAKFSSAAFVIIKIFIGFSLFRLIGKSFIVSFINIMFLIACISLIGFIINSYWGYMPGFHISDISTSLVLYTELFDSYFGFIGRNSGMFWEPGAFEGYLNLALCFLIISKDISHRAFKLLVLSAALITTYSTTGYVVFAFIIGCYLLFFFEGPVLLRVALIAIFFTSALFLYQSLDFLQQKILLQSSAMDEGRLVDYKSFSGIIRDHFLIGMTAGTMEELGIGRSGNGFLGFWIRFGILGLLYYFIVLFVKFYRSIGLIKALFVFVVVVLTLQGEAFLVYPLYLALPFLEIENKDLKVANFIK